MMSLAFRNLNPLNIRYSPMNNWKGQCGSYKGFCKFSSLDLGFRAAIVLLCNYHRKGYDTISKIVEHWAPASENDTKAYIRFVSDNLVDLYGHHSDDSASADFSNQYIDSFEFICSICLEMSRYEIGKKTFDRFAHDIIRALNNAIADYKYPELCFRRKVTSQFI